MDHLWTPYRPLYGSSMTHDRIGMALLWTLYGPSMAPLWPSMDPYGLPYGPAWTHYGPPMDSLWTLYDHWDGHPMDPL